MLCSSVAFCFKHLGTVDEQNRRQAHGLGGLSTTGAIRTPRNHRVGKLPYLRYGLALPHGSPGLSNTKKKERGPKLRRPLVFSFSVQAQSSAETDIPDGTPNSGIENPKLKMCPNGCELIQKLLVSTWNFAQFRVCSIFPPPSIVPGALRWRSGRHSGGFTQGRGCGSR